MKPKGDVDIILLGHSIDRMTCRCRVGRFGHRMVVKVYLQCRIDLIKDFSIFKYSTLNALLPSSCQYKAGGFVDRKVGEA